MTRDRETERIAFLGSEPADNDFPRGKRGRGWQVRRAEIDEAVWDDLMAARMTGEEMDVLHETKWEEGVAP